MIDRDFEVTFPLSKTGLHANISISPATSWRWAMKGIRGERLETILICGRRYTSRAAVDRFLARLSEPRAMTTPGPSERRKEQIARASKRAAETF